MKLARCIGVILLKELRENLTDRRSLLSMGLISVAAGPLLLLFLSTIMASYEASAERRVVLASGLQWAPHFERFAQSHGYRIESVAPDFQDRLKSGTLRDPVMIVPEGFETALTARTGLRAVPAIEILTDSSNRAAHSGVGRVQRLLAAYESQLTTYQFALGGRSLAQTEQFHIQMRDLSSEQARGGRLLSMLPFFLIMAALYAAWGAAMESIAGERERGVREALLTTPAGVGAIVLGKWAGVWAFAALMTGLAIWSFLPTQFLIDSEHLRSIFVLRWPDCALMTVVMLPASALIAALMMWAAVGARTLRAAQAQSSLVALIVAVFPTLVTLAPAKASGLAVLLPVAGQAEVLNRILQGESSHVSELTLLSALTFLCAAILLRWIALRYIQS